MEIDSSNDEPRFWLADPILKKVSKGMVVEIRGSSGDISWFGGEQEGRRGRVEGVIVIPNNMAYSTVTVVMLHDSTRLIVPTQYIWPVSPEKVQERAIILEGKRKGKLVVIRAEGDIGWVVSPYQDPIAFELTEDQLVQVVCDDPEGAALV